MSNWGNGGLAVIYLDVLMSVKEIAGEPGEGMDEDGKEFGVCREKCVVSSFCVSQIGRVQRGVLS